VLFDLVRLTRIRPWDVNLSYILSSFLNEMRKSGYIDFSVSGTALLSSAILLRLQSELVLKLEEPPAPPAMKPVEYIPPPIQLPFRYEYTSTTVYSLVEALAEAIKTEAAARQPRPQPLLPPPPEIFQEYDKFFIEIESRLDELYEELKSLSSGEAIAFSSLVKNKDRTGVVVTFLLLLFLSAGNRVELSQEEEFGELYIRLVRETGESGSILTS